MAPRRILLTGAGGFLGRHLEAALGREHHVLAPRHGELELLDLDALRAWLDRNPVDLVLHAATWNATATGASPERVLEANLRMFFHLAGEGHRYGRLVHLGSGAEFGRAFWRADLREEELGRHVPGDAYGLSKFVAARFAQAAEGISHVRLFGVFGPGEDWRVRFPSGCAVRALFGRPLTLRQDRDFDYLDACDVASALAALIRLDRWPKSLNLCRGEAHRLSHVASLIQRTLGTALPLEVGQEGLDRGYGGDASVLRALLPEWRPRPLEASLGALCDDLRGRRSELDPDRLLP